MNTIFDNQTRAALLEAALLEYVERYGLTKKATLFGPLGADVRHISVGKTLARCPNLPGHFTACGPYRNSA